ncbi:MAG TPA: lysylphosphatidylglycerol synthase transmembrane domain-containing protein [Candidatus Limiplasma sp.]|nr:lysylphosphatidylglycerol synthase transmembrane domain-containing protein [Candidatus Limiplasma sp.]HPS82066.1 lysylphosphatidylglycerol synthase transmembrane domain-containing protein [Candidatus Limiplasma sp.]
MKSFLAFLKKNWLILLGIVLSVSTILTFFLVTDGVATLKQIYQSLQYGWLILGFGFVIVQWAFDALGLHLLVRQHQPHRRFFSSIVTTMVGVFYSAITPSATGGQPMQVISLSKQGMETGTATSVIIVKTMLYQIAITIYALAMVVLELPFFQQHVSSFSFVVLFAMAISVLFIGGLFLFTVNQKLTRKLGHGFIHLLSRLKLCRDEQRLHHRLEVQFEQFFISASTLGNSWKLCIGVILTTLCQLTCYFVVPFCIYRSFGLSGESVLRLLAATTFVYFASMFVPVPGASGGAEGSFFLFFSPFFPAGTIAPAILLWRLFTYYGAIIVGVIFTTMDRKHPKPAVAVAENAEQPSAKAEPNA